MLGKKISHKTILCGLVLLAGASFAVASICPDSMMSTTPLCTKCSRFEENRVEVVKPLESPFQAAPSMDTFNALAKEGSLKASEHLAGSTDPIATFTPYTLGHDFSYSIQIERSPYFMPMMTDQPVAVAGKSF